jgi:CRP-like cAMP-binding protein
LIDLKKFINSLSPITESTWKKVSSLFVPADLKKGEYFIKEKLVTSKIAFLQKGVIRAFYENEKGVEYNKHFFLPPCFIGGYSSLISGKPNQILQQALTDCNLLVADFNTFSRLYDTCPDLERVARKLAEWHFVNKEQREIEIVLLDANKRYLMLQQQFPGLEQIVSQYHIASYLGITPTQLSRIRRKMKSSTSLHR